MRVLVVDDDADTVEVLALCLVVSQGWEVEAVTTGLQALTICRSRELDAVLLDVDMPGLDGPGVLAGLRADPRTAHLPVVFVTACVGPAVDARLRLLGALAVVPKPFDALSIGDQVAGYLGWSRHHQGRSVSGPSVGMETSNTLPPPGAGRAPS